MSFLDELGLKAAEQLELSVGPYVALASYKRLFAAPPALRAKAVFAALRCAVDLSDDRETRELASTWSLERDAELAPRGAADPRLSTPSALVGRLLFTGRRGLGVELARAEVARRPSAHAHYVLARATDEAAGPDLDQWALVVAAAKAEGAQAILTRGVARWLELVLWSPSAPRMSRPLREEIVAHALLPDLGDAGPAERLVVLRARLLGASRFARASALSGLEELARTGPPSVRLEAVIACARHVDVADGRLDPIESDRVRAALKHWPVERERDAAIARLDAAVEVSSLAKRGRPGPSEIDRAASLVAASAPESVALVNRVRAIVGGGTAAGVEPVVGGPPSARLSALGLDVVVALSKGLDGEAAHAIVKATDALPPMAAIPGPLWTGARMALRAKSGETRRAAASFVEQALLRSASGPPFGLSSLAADLARAGAPAVAAMALREAVRWKEPGAARALADAERSLAYAALSRGDRRRALELLRNAKRLYAEAS